MTYNKTAFELAHERMRRAPLELTEADFEQLETIDPALETKGREAQRQAQLSLVHKHMPVLQTKDASPADRSRRPLTLKHLEMFADQVGTVLVELMKQNVLPLKERVTALEAKPHVKFTGTFKPGTTYAPGDAATHHGSLWICKAATSGKPGEDHIGWQLAVKSRSIV